MVKYRATSLDKTFASNIRKLFLLKISLFLYIPLVILISKCCSAFPELAVIVLNWERSMLTLSFLCSHMCLLWKWISSQFGWTHDNDTKTFITIWAFLFYLTSIMLFSCSVHQLYTFFKIFCHTNYCQKVFSTTFVEIKSASYPFLRMDVRLFLCFNPVLGKTSIRFGQQMDEENALYLWAILWHTRGSYFVPGFGLRDAILGLLT